MKSIIVFLIFLFPAGLTFGQSQEAQQLLLNVEKLSQLKGILSNMKKGYQIVSNGYNSVKNIAQGNFSLHHVFLDAMMLVSPEVRKYHRIAEIIGAQSDLMSEYKQAAGRFAAGGNFSVSEIAYLEKVYRGLIDASISNLDQLAMIITSHKLRMTDDERLRAIDQVFVEVQDKLTFLRNFNSETSMLDLQRKRMKSEIGRTQDLFQKDDL